MSKTSERTGRWSRGAPWLGALAVLSGVACAQILGLEEWPGGSTSGSGGGAGMGGATVSSSASASAGGGSSASSASSSTSGSSSGSGIPCPCPPDPECAAYSCVNNQCTLTYTLIGFYSKQQIPYDCLTRICDGAGGVMMKLDASDHFPSDACNTYSCDNGNQVSTPAVPGTSCGAKQTCNGFGMCQQCSGVIPSCNDFCADMGEADTDCGALCFAVGKLCGPGKHCFDKTDCTTNNCVNNICAP